MESEKNKKNSLLLSKASLTTFIIQGFSIVLVFVSSKVLLDIFGTETFGIYAYANGIITLVAMLVSAGFSNLLIKQLPIYYTKNNSSGIKQLQKWCTKNVFVLSLTGALFVLSFLFILRTDFSFFNSLITAICIPLLSLALINQASLNALKHYAPSQLAEKIVKPAAIILLAFTCTFIAIPYSGKFQILFLNLLSFGITFILSIYFIQKYTSKDSSSIIKVAHSEAEWLNSVRNLSLVSIISIAGSKIDTLILGSIANSEHVAIYTIALRFAEFVSFPLLIANIIIIPHVSKMYQDKEHLSLQKQLTHSSRITTVASLGILILFAITGHSLLDFFNEDISKGYIPLLLLGFAQLVNVSCGSVGYLLILTGNENKATKAVAFSLALQIILTFILVPKYNELGTAIATATGVICWNIIMLFYCVKYLKINPSIFPLHVGKT